jgi:hypothetical protein
VTRVLSLSSACGFCHKSVALRFFVAWKLAGESVPESAKNGGNVNEFQEFQESEEPTSSNPWIYV